MKKHLRLLSTLALTLLFAASAIGASTQTATPPAKKPAPPPPYLSPINKSIQPTSIIPYKTIGNTTLNLHVFLPKNAKPTDKRPCFFAIHGGGWTGGAPLNMYAYCQWAANNGMIAVSVQYRLYNAKDPSTSVYNCVRDVRSAIRYIKENAAKLGIDPDKIITTGASAGGHLSLAPAMFKFDDATDNLAINTNIAAMIPLSPVIDTSTEGYGNAKVLPDWQSLSPRHNVTKGLPPTLLLHGTADKTTPYLGAEIFAKEMKAAGNNITFITREDGNHTYMFKTEKDYKDSIQQITAFLTSLKLLPVPPQK